MERADTQVDVQPGVEAPPARTSSSGAQRDQEAPAFELASHSTGKSCSANPMPSAPRSSEGAAGPASGGQPASHPSPAKRPAPPSPLKQINKGKLISQQDAGHVGPSDEAPPMKRLRADTSPPARPRPSQDPTASPMKTPADLMQRLSEYVETCGGSLGEGWSVDVCSPTAIHEMPQLFSNEQS